jgi:hypothetical protein
MFDHRIASYFLIPAQRLLFNLQTPSSCFVWLFTHPIVTLCLAEPLFIFR